MLIAAFEVTFSGSEAAETLADTEAGSGLTTLPDDVFLDAVITQIAAANERGHALWTVLLGAALSDPVVDAALQRILANRAADYRGFAAELQRRGIVDSDHDGDALADVLSFLLSPESHQQLVGQSGWSPDRYRSWLRSAVLAAASPSA